MRLLIVRAAVAHTPAASAVTCSGLSGESGAAWAGKSSAGGSETWASTPSRRPRASENGVQPEGGRVTSMLGPVVARRRSRVDLPHPGPAVTNVRR